jgi:hypothetical protein
MKRTFLYIMMAALLTACGHRASQQGAAENDSVAVAPEFQVDSISIEHEDSMASVTISIDWPTSGSDSLMESIRQYLCEELASSPIQEGEPQVKYYDDGPAAVRSTVASRYEELTASWKELKSDGYPGMELSFYLRSMLLENAEQYITYLTKSEGFLGGAHGFASAAGQTFRKSDGKRIGYQTAYNKKTESFEQKDQTLFKDTMSPQLYALIKEGVRNYFKEFDESVVSDEQLKDLLISVDDVNRIPLPSAPPTFSKNGLSFIYQQYEIAPYAAGMINFDIPYEKVRPFLTPEAAALIPE